MAGDRVGFVGLGIMGRPMARNLMRAGHELVVHSRSRGPVDELVGEGAEAAESPREVAERCWATITMLPDSPDVREAMLGEAGALAGASEADLLIDMSTISPEVAREVAVAAGARGVAAVDAPVTAGTRAPSTACCRSWPAARRWMSNAPGPCSRPWAPRPIWAGRAPAR